MDGTEKKQKVMHFFRFWIVGWPKPGYRQAYDRKDLAERVGHTLGDSLGQIHRTEDLGRF